jgi:transketolase
MQNQSKDIGKLAADTIRILSAEAVEKAASGHPGMPMGCADYAFVLWSKYLRHNPADPAWPGRDRFILSAGHGSMLLYSLLHLSGYGISIEDIKNFRQWGSHTPGHPERNPAHAIEVTTGPLGQGFAMGVGMAIAQKMLAARFGKDLFGGNIFSIAGDGCVMEGVSSEAASLAGHLGLGNIVYFYDDNRITIEGPTNLAFSEDTAKRFESYGWHVLKIDGHDQAACAAAIEAGVAETERPTLIIGRTHIAYGSPGKADNASAHGAPLGAEELAAVKKNLGWENLPEFHVPKEVRTVFENRAVALKAEYNLWQNAFKAARSKADFTARWDAFFSGETAPELAERLLKYLPEKPQATRQYSGAALQQLAEELPGLVGGSADLAPSNNTLLKKFASIKRGDFAGRNIHFGVREFAMASVSNGMALFGGIIPYAGTFLIFSDYMRPAMRHSALMGARVVYVLTHDSFFVGEDGPTHQPIEHLASLRAMPNMAVWRPADRAETAAAWEAAVMRKNGPTALMLTRQEVPILPMDAARVVSSARRGAYILADTADPQIVIIATGSEVGLALEARTALESAGIKTRVISMPCTQVFEAQDKTYRDKVLPPQLRKRVVIEAAATFGWERHAGADGLLIGLDRFGASAPGKVLKEKFGFTAKSALERISRKWPELNVKI